MFTMPEKPRPSVTYLSFQFIAMIIVIHSSAHLAQLVKGFMISGSFGLSVSQRWKQKCWQNRLLKSSLDLYWFRLWNPVLCDFTQKCSQPKEPSYVAKSYLSLDLTVRVFVFVSAGWIPVLLPGRPRVLGKLRSLCNIKEGRTHPSH